MKLKLITLSLLSAFSVLSVSCDGGSSSSSDGDADSIASSLTARELQPGDKILYTSSENLPVIISSLDLTTGGGVVEGGSIYQYTKTGNNLFTIERRSSSNATTNLSNALESTLGGTDAGGNLGSRLRVLLQRDSPDFTPEELLEIARILNPFGSNLSVSTDGTLIGFTGGTHTHLVRSTVGDRNRGSMGGTYNLTSPGREIIFREPTAQEVTLYRFLDSGYWLPSVSSEFRGAELIEKGTWTLELGQR